MPAIAKVPPFIVIAEALTLNIPTCSTVSAFVPTVILLVLIVTVAAVALFASIPRFEPTGVPTAPETEIVLLFSVRAVPELSIFIPVVTGPGLNAMIELDSIVN